MPAKIGDVRAVRAYGKRNGWSVYRCEVRVGPPTFNRGDGKDEGRNLISAALIGASWETTGYLVGYKGRWLWARADGMAVNPRMGVRYKSTNEGARALAVLAGRG